MERRGIETEVGKRISLEMATQRLERAAEFGRIERAREEVQRSILDLSGDLQAAQKERGPAPPAASKQSVEEIAAESRKRWLQGREAARQSGAPMTLEDIRRQGREDWLALRAELAQEASPAAAPSVQKSIGLEPEAHRPAADDKSQELTLDQIKAQGRAALENVKQELQAERERERQRQVALEKERSLSRGRGRGRGRGGPGMER
jgi:hypothetical protein